MSDLLRQEFKVICGRTKGMTSDEMYRMYNTAIQWKKNPAALLHKLLKERNKQLKQHGMEKNPTGGSK